MNLKWVESFLRSQVFNMLIIGSDHALVLVDSYFYDVKGKKKFKFEIIWVEKGECGQIIREG